MKVKLLKSGAWSMHQVFGPVYDFEEGQTHEDTPENCRMLIDAEWAEEVSGNAKAEDLKPEPQIEPEKAQEDTSETSSDSEAADPRAELEKLVADAGDTKEAKLALEAWGKEHAKIDVNRSKSVKNIIKEILEAL